MAEKMLKGTLLVSLMLVMAIGAPAMARADISETQGFNIGDMFGSVGDLEGFMGVLPGFFDGMGGAGQVLGQIFSLLLPQFMNLSAQEMIPGFYVLNATAETNRTSSFEVATGQRTYYADYDYYSAAISALNSQYGPGNYSYPYCVVSRSGAGNVTVTKTVGMSVTIGIWDADKTLIKTINRVIQTLKTVQGMMGSEANYDAALEEAISSVLYLLIHINDIITGDELIVVNPITYEFVNTTGTFGESHKWKIETGFTGGVRTIRDLETDCPGVMSSWQSMADGDNNGFMNWLLGPDILDGPQNAKWGRFSFDLIQLWLKKFYVSLDMAEIVNLINGMSGESGTPNPAKILKDLDIEFYLIWHHLIGGVFYSDTIIANDKIDVSYKNVTYPNGTVVTTPEGTVVQRPDSSEVTHFIGMKSMDGVIWNNPTVSADKSRISWGVRFVNMTIFWTPVGMDPEDRARNSPPNATLEFLDLGFTFIPGANVPLLNTDGTPSGKEGKDGQIKLDQRFGRWRGALQPWQIDANLTGLDFAMVYVSTLLHVHFTGELLEKISSGDASSDWDEASNEGYVDSSHVNETHELKFGAGSASSSLMVGKVDIAGPGYDIDKWLAPGTADRKPASTQIIPVALFTLDAQAGMSYTDNKMSGGGFDAAAMLGVEFSVMLYSVNYPAFSDITYNGGQIWHDPTFSIFMTFEAGTYWAIILLVGVVALVGIAAILITRSKNNR